MDKRLRCMDKYLQWIAMSREKEPGVAAFDTSSSTADLEDASGGSLIALILGGVALLAALAAIGLVFYKSSQNVDPQPKLDTLSAQITELSEKVSLMEAQLATARGQASGVNEVRQDMQKLTQSAQQRINELGAAIKTNRDRIQTQGESLIEVVEAIQKFNQRSSTAVAPAQQKDTEPAATATSSGSSGETVHVIRPGDSFAKLAKEYGVPMLKIQDANPGVDPLRLQIGQEIKIPQE